MFLHSDLNHFITNSNWEPPAARCPAGLTSWPTPLLLLPGHAEGARQRQFCSLVCIGTTSALSLWQNPALKIVSWNSKLLKQESPSLEQKGIQTITHLNLFPLTSLFLRNPIPPNTNPRKTDQTLEKKKQFHPYWVVMEDYYAWKCTYLWKWANSFKIKLFQASVNSIIYVFRNH